ncbi:MAG: efflux RND transporter periplasmic adaptor subunit [Thermosynechococcaceae cyanobacterium]
MGSINQSLALSPCDRPANAMLSDPSTTDESAPEPPHTDAVQKPKVSLSGRGNLMLGMGIGVAIALGGMALMNRSTPKAATPPAQANPGGQQSVSVATAQWQTTPQTIPVQGSVEARDWVSVMPRAPGVQIKSISVQEGQSVNQGEVIAVLDNAVQREQLNQAQAQASSAQAQAASAETQLSSAQAQAQGAQAQLISAQATVAQKQAQLKQQQAALAEAESNQRRYARLSQQGAISTQELESRNTVALSAQAAIRVAQADIDSALAGVNNAQAQVEQAQAAVNTARAGVLQARANRQNAIARQRELNTQLEQATLVQAPASGIIAKKNANVGDLTGTTPLFSIISNSALELQAKVPETLLPKVRLGAISTVTSDSDQRIKVQGTVREIDPVVEAKTRQATVKIGLPGGPLLKPGMFLRAAIAYSTAQAVTVPTEAVVAQTDGQTLVYVVAANNIVKAIPVKVGDPVGGRIAVKEGLKAGDRVAVAGAGFVKDGDRVNVVQ